ncbi:ABC transporter substrate-binding protein [Labilibaculum euxinus]|uniref:ABC transporter substrate-binding protein n=1 Tax=Labilibaculum euxinus TaxID=2686357 RepID=A0A7M4D1I0_9BACT|nr:helical backbone metal receptor [Labilibaculum euxinus]MUP36509.1 ABC transporter substrate-binding protein [Labilibaculum euxinus]MVB05714.1 ABC transporter substrate-binding protein [Labilibaculum euxinus]
MENFIKVTDDLGRKINIPFPPKRIISTVPSTTEFLFDLGLGDRVISKTKFCKYPKDKIAKLPNIGGPKDLYFDKINLLDPDIIFANEEENSKNQIEALMVKFTVYVCKVRNYDEALQNILNTGKIVGAETKAFEIANHIHAGFSQLPIMQNSLSVLYLIWKNPYMAAGKDTFINSMIDKCGFKNVIEDNDSRYPQLTDEEIQTLNPDLIFLSSEPFPFTQKHIPEIQNLLPNTKIELVDGEMFSWFESHLLKAGKYFKDLIQKINS